jgi:hypothetical protein
VLERWKKGVREDEGEVGVRLACFVEIRISGGRSNMLISREIRMNGIEQRGHDGYGYVQGSDARWDAEVGDGREGGEAEGRERVGGEDQADRELMTWVEDGDESLMRKEENGPLPKREEDGEDRSPRIRRSEQVKLLDQAEDVLSRSEQDGPSSRSEQIAPPDACRLEAIAAYQAAAAFLWSLTKRIKTFERWGWRFVGCASTAPKAT